MSKGEMKKNLSVCLSYEGERLRMRCEGLNQSA